MELNPSLTSHWHRRRCWGLAMPTVADTPRLWLTLEERHGAGQGSCSSAVTASPAVAEPPQDRQAEPQAAGAGPEDPGAAGRRRAGRLDPPAVGAPIQTTAPQKSKSLPRGTLPRPCSVGVRRGVYWCARWPARLPALPSGSHLQRTRSSSSGSRWRAAPSPALRRPPLCPPHTGVASGGAGANRGAVVDEVKH
jgi:hypothetical protein